MTQQGLQLLQSVLRTETAAHLMVFLLAIILCVLMVIGIILSRRK